MSSVFDAAYDRRLHRWCYSRMPRHREAKMRCIQYFGIYFIISGLAVICIGAAETLSLTSNFTYAGLTFISCGIFLLLAHHSMRNLRRDDGWLDDRLRQSSVFHTGSDDTVLSVDVSIETVRDYLAVSKRTGNALEIDIRPDGNMTCTLTDDEEVDPALFAACSIPDMDTDALDLHLYQINALGKVLRLVKRTSTAGWYENGKVCAHEDGTVAIHIWHGFGADNEGCELDVPPVYDDAVRIPPIREEEPPSYSDVVLTMDSAL